MSDLVQEIKNALTIEQVMGDYVQLKKVGRGYKSLCPFHKEKTASFIITPDKGLAYCFGCHTGGDIFECVQKLENVDFPESVRILAKKSGLEHKLKDFRPEQKTKLTPLFDYSRDMSEAYHQALFTRDDAKIAREYLKKRGVTEEIQKEFQIGYAPDSFDFSLEIGKKKEYTEQDMVMTGILIRNEQQKIYDRFRNRLMFPLCNAQGTVLGFSGRTLEDTETAKYINSSDSPIFSKKDILFGLHFSKESIRSLNYAILVEGQFDVVLCHQVGMKNVIASSGTAFGEGHLKHIERYTQNIAFAFDADTAGVQAAQKAIELAYAHHFNVKVIMLPQKKDPADIILQQGKEAWLECVKQAVHPVDFYFSQLKNIHDPKNLQGKKAILKDMKGLWDSLQSSVDREYMLEQLELLLGVSKDHIDQELVSQKKTVRSSEKNISQETFKYSLVEYLLAYIIRYPVCLKFIKDFETLLELFPSQWKELYNAIKDKYNQASSEVFVDDILHVPSIKNTNIVQLSVFLEEYYPFEISDEEIEIEFQKLLVRIKESYKKKRRREITIEMKIAEANNDTEAIETLQKEQIDLIRL